MGNPTGTNPDGTPTYRYWYQRVSTTRDLIDNAGLPVVGGHFTYDAYGQVTDGNTGLTRYLYTARELDSATGLQYNRARWYDSGTGRWTSEDPIPFIDGSNNYIYVGNSPTNFTDPLGLARVTQTAVSKSYINTITNPGYLPSLDATFRLWKLALFTNVNPYIHDGQRTTPAADGEYRLRAQIDISLDVHCDKISNLNVTHTEQGGQESPIHSGTINVLEWEENVSKSVKKVHWLTWGRPHKFSEIAFQEVYERTSVNIWHQVALTITGSGESASFSVEEFVGSAFPSHRLWVGAGLEGDRPQGAFSSLWKGDAQRGPNWVTR